MIKKVYSVYDSKAGAYLPPFMMRSHGEAIRGFQDVVNDGKSMFSAHPEDYTLFHIADFDEISGKYKLPTAQEALATGLNVRNQNKEQ